VVYGSQTVENRGASWYMEAKLWQIVVCIFQDHTAAISHTKPQYHSGLSSWYTVAICGTIVVPSWLSHDDWTQPLTGLQGDVGYCLPVYAR
jgi:hypothetical protein